MKRVFIIHGYGGHPNENWFPWLKSHLEAEGFMVDVPQMPNADQPKFSEWLSFLQKEVGTPDGSTFLVGHSLGCITILRYLESLPEGIVLPGIILVAGFAEPIHLTELNNFFVQPLDTEKIRKSVKQIVAISSDNDPHVPFEVAERLQKSLGAELLKIHNGGHLNEKTGYTSFPLVLDRLIQLAKENY